MDRASFNPKKLIRDHLAESVRVKSLVADQCGADIERAAALITESFRKGGKLMLCGNGGSAADCQHLAAEFTSRLTKDFPRPALPAIALTTDTSFITAFANDISYEGIFERQVEALGKPGDVLLGISTSGSSGNVIKAVQKAKAQGMETVVLCGSGGSLPSMVSVAVKVPSNVTQHIQESHLAIYHIICAIVERELFLK
jgi:phosphoheptose isomerase